MSRLLDALRSGDGPLVCEYCGVPLIFPDDSGVHPFAAVADHRIPKSRGGPDGVWNTAIACRTCDWDKGNRTVGEWRQGLSVGSDPIPPLTFRRREPLTYRIELPEGLTL